MTSLERVFKEFIRENPFNAAATVLRTENQLPPESFGGNCIELCINLRERILKEFPDLEVEFLTQQIGTHQALIVKTPDKKKFLLDPTILHDTPINLPDQSSAEVTQYGQETVPGSPIIFKVTHTEAGIRISRYSYSEISQNYQLRVTYAFRLKTTKDPLQVTSERVFMNKSVLPAIFRTNSGIYTVRFNQPAQSITTGFFSKPKKQTPLDNFDSISEDLAPVSQSTDITIQDLMNMFKNAFQIFTERAYLDLD